MKEHKPSYILSSYISYILFVFSISLLIIPILCTIGYMSEEYFMTIKLLGLYCIFFMFFSIIFITLHLLVKIFVKKKIIITNDAITYKNTIIEYKRIRRIDFIFPEVGRSNNKPYKVNIYYKADYVKDYLCMTVERMPFICIYNICKKCNDKVFHINGFKKIYIVLPICIIVLGFILDFILYWIK